jgi:hypothetical protein
VPVESVKLFKPIDFLSEAYKSNDMVWIHYWATGDLVVVKVLASYPSKVHVSYNYDGSPLFGAPDEYIKPSQIVARFRKT